MSERTGLTLPEVCRGLRVPYGSAWKAVMDGRLPAERRAPGGRWRIMCDVATAARLLGVAPPAEPEKRGKRRAA